MTPEIGKCRIGSGGILGVGTVREFKPVVCDAVIVAGARGVRRLCKKSHVRYDTTHMSPAAALDARL